MKNYVRLPLANAYNARDLGGYSCSSGGVTRWRQFVRSDELSMADKNDIQFLKEYGINTIVDLRSADELQYMPCPGALKEAVEYRSIPLMSGNVSDMANDIDRQREDYMASNYLSWFKERHDAFKTVLEVFANAREGGILFNCAAGKDRTGVVAAVLLGLAGVSEADILGNYQVTDTYLMKKPLMENPLYAEIAKGIPQAHSRSDISYLQPSLEYVESCGGMSGYLKSIGVTEETQNKLLKRLVE